MDPEYVEEKVCAMDDLADAIQTWKDIDMLATVFQQTGLVISTRDAPREITGDW